MTQARGCLVILEHNHDVVKSSESSTPIQDLFDSAQDRVEQERMLFLAEIGQSFASSLDLDSTLINAVQRIVDYVEAEAGSIFILENDDTELVCRACAGPVDITGLRLPADAGIVGRTVREGKPVMVRDVREDPDFTGSVDKSTGFETRSILSAPLNLHGRPLGVIQVINKRRGDHLFEPLDQTVLQVLAASGTLAIHNARMAGRLVEQERIQRELDLARDLQRSLLPTEQVQPYPIAGVNISAREVSGDFFDHFRLDDGRIYFSLGDVSGKGMNAALLMAKCSSLLRCLARMNIPPRDLLARVNNELVDSATHGMFVTAVTGNYDQRSGKVVWANAGHQPPLLREENGHYQEYPAESPPLGIVPDIDFPEAHMQLGKSSLYLFTDGVTEGRDFEGCMLEVSGFSAIIDEYADASAEERIQAVIEHIQQQPLHDDITLMVLDGMAQHPDGKLLGKLTFNADPTQLKGVRDMVRDAAGQSGFGKEEVDQVVIAANEACMNVIEHGYKGNKNGEIRLEIFDNERKMIIRLIDVAPSVDPKTVKPRDLDDIRPGGLGTHFISEIMDGFTFLPCEGEVGNILEMVKNK